MSGFFKEFKKTLSIDFTSTTQDTLNLYNYYLQLFVDYVTLICPINIIHQSITLSSQSASAPTSLTLIPFQQEFLWFVKRWSKALDSTQDPSDITILPYLPVYVIREISSLLSTSSAQTSSDQSASDQPATL